MEDLQEKINVYRMKRARNFSLAIMLYILAVAELIALSIMFDEKGGEIGVVLMFVIAAIATGIIVFTNMSIPQELIPYFKKHESEYEDYTSERKEENHTEESNPNISPKKVLIKDKCKDSVFSSIIKLYWLVVTIVYLGISFATYRWDITWLIWLIAVAIEQVIKILYHISKDNR